MYAKIERHWFEVWGTEVAQNRILKALLFGSLVVIVAESASLAILALKPPLLFAITSSETKLVTTLEPPSQTIAAEVRHVVSRYLDARHTWQWPNIDRSFESASHFVDPTFMKRFRDATAPQIRLARQKKISQRFFVTSVTIDSATRLVRVTGERILEIDTLRAVTSQSFSLTYTFGSRTAENPEGVYLTSESLENEGASNRGEKSQ